MTDDLHVVVLAAGKGTRMRSALPKVLHRAAGLPLIEWVVRAARGLRPQSITIVLGHGSDQVREWFDGATDIRFVIQEPQLGTGHALLQAERVLSGRHGTVLLLSGDAPLVTKTSLERVVALRRHHGASVVVATADLPDPSGYGRIVRDGGALARIVEDRDATPAERLITEVNSGIYAFSLASLFDALRGLGSSNAQGEYYLPELVVVHRRAGRVVVADRLSDADEIRGINTRAELATVSRLLQQRINTSLMAAGVTLEDPATAYIGPDVTIGPDTVLHPFVFLEGRTVVGPECEFHSGARIVDSVVGSRVTVFNHTIVAESTLADDTRVGPFARIRPNSSLGAGSHVGNFVEIKQSAVGDGSKIGHLSYIGDASLGAGVNIGAGTITCNYDGRSKHRTTIGDKAFVGSDSTLVAPVTIGAGAYVAAGSAITEDVPAGGLGIARGRQTNKPGWADARAAAKDREQ
ncbi:MAG: bifunctional UDP-N-acetylglucosamine diphosphorylase/glucosamine-1-phosphate N-acetyltransferase GlmU [Vicinamibacterales bacterium]